MNLGINGLTLCQQQPPSNRGTDPRLTGTDSAESGRLAQRERLGIRKRAGGRCYKCVTRDTAAGGRPDLCIGFTQTKVPAGFIGNSPTPP